MPGPDDTVKGSIPGILISLANGLIDSDYEHAARRRDHTD
jgi:hypothetical protein